MMAKKAHDEGNEVDNDWSVHGENPFRHNNPIRGHRFGLSKTAQVIEKKEESFF